MNFYRDRRVGKAAPGIAGDKIDWEASPWTVLYGDPGTGKTVQLMGVLEKWAGWEYLPVIDFWNELRSMKNNDEVADVIRVAQTCQRLAIDDLGFEPDRKFNVWGTDYEPVEEMKNVLFLRHAKGLPTAISTNLDSHGLEERYKKRIYDRIKELATFYYFKGSFRDGKIGRVTRDKHKPLVTVASAPFNPPKKRALAPVASSKAVEEEAAAVANRDDELGSVVREMALKVKGGKADGKSGK